MCDNARALKANYDDAKALYINNRHRVLRQPQQINSSQADTNLRT